LKLTNNQIQELLNGCRNNNRESQRIFYEWLKEYAVNICYRYTTNFHEMEELVSEGFIKVYKNIHLYNESIYSPSEAAFKGWFKRVLINTCINWFRKKYPPITDIYTEPEIVLQKAESESVLDSMSYKEIIHSIKELSPAYRTVFNLFIIDGMSHEEIAEQLGISIGASKSNLFKAKENLKKILLKKMDIKKYA
jgi:RNA polymerase sigma-70 factor (ECF subfamily)